MWCTNKFLGLGIQREMPTTTTSRILQSRILTGQGDPFVCSTNYENKSRTFGWLSQQAIWPSESKEFLASSMLWHRYKVNKRLKNGNESIENSRTSVVFSQLENLDSLFPMGFQPPHRLKQVKMSGALKEVIRQSHRSLCCSPDGRSGPSASVKHWPP